MNDQIVLPKEVLATIAIETWRLEQNLTKLSDQHNSVAIKYSLKKLKQTLENQGCVFLDLVGKAYDAGLALEVIDVEENDLTSKITGGQTKFFIKETIIPIILLQNKLLVSGQVILAKLNE